MFIYLYYIDFIGEFDSFFAFKDYISLLNYAICSYWS